MNYRQMQISDYDALLACWQDQVGITINDCDTHAGIERFLQRNPGLSFVAEDNGNIVGTLMCGHDGRRGYLHHMWVDSQQRGQGIAKHLFELCIKALEAIAIHKAHLFVLIDNKAAHDFWSNVGCEQREDLHIFSYTGAALCA